MKILLLLLLVSISSGDQIRGSDFDWNRAELQAGSALDAAEASLLDEKLVAYLKEKERVTKDLKRLSALNKDLLGVTCRTKVKGRICAQEQDWAFNRLAKTGRETLPPGVSWAQAHAHAPNYAGTLRFRALVGKDANDRIVDFGMDSSQLIYPDERLWGAAGVCAVIVVWALAVGIVGLVRKGFRDQKMMAALFVGATLVVSLELTQWVWRAGGVMYSGQKPRPNELEDSFTIPLLAATIISRVSAMLVLALFALFTYVLISATIKTVAPERSHLLKPLLIGFVLYIGAVFVVSVVSTSLAVTFATSFFFYDSSLLLFAISLVLFGALLVTSLAATLHYVRKGVEGASAQLMRSTAIFLAVVSLALCVFISNLGIVIHDEFVGFFERDYIPLVFSLVAHLCAVSLVLAYVTVRLLPSLSRQKTVASHEDGGYVPLEEGVPSQYVV